MDAGNVTVEMAPANHDDRAALRASRIWSDADVRGLPLIDAQLVSVGGGLASFALVDLLRVVGVGSEDIRVVGPHPSPVDAFRHFARSSQIGEHDRLRSDSSARVDNVWGFPGYALEESLARRSPRPLWTVLTEPVATEFFTPVSAHVYDGVATEAERISWAEMGIRGHVEMVRPRAEGGLFSLVHDDGRSCSVIRSRYVHLGLGYPALRLTKELQRYRAEHGGGFSAVNAYEPHDHVYSELARSGGTVLLRGAGITASRVLERLIDLRDSTGQDIRILHLVRHAGSGTAPFGRRHKHRRTPRAATAWNYQAFNFPKAALGGQLAERLARIEDDDERATLIAGLGGTTTPRRRRWRDQLRRAEAEGYYRLLVGSVATLSPGRRCGVRVRLLLGADTGTDSPSDLDVDFLVDCTGMQADAAAHPLLADLCEVGLARRNSVGRLRVDENFELREARHDGARVFATGAMAFGSRVGPVDSFWGMNHGAMAVCDELSRLGFCPRLTTARSVAGWWRWTRRRSP